MWGGFPHQRLLTLELPSGHFDRKMSFDYPRHFCIERFERYILGYLCLYGNTMKMSWNAAC